MVQNSALCGILDGRKPVTSTWVAVTALLAVLPLGTRGVVHNDQQIGVMSGNCGLDSVTIGVGNMVEFNPTHEIRDGANVVWQVPSNPRGILYLAHGASTSPLAYFPPTPSAPECTGLVENVVLVRKALERGYAVLLGDGIKGLWDIWPTSKQDAQNQVKLLTEWPKEHKLEGLPVFGWGSSLGGNCISSLATVYKFKAIVIMISRGRAEAWETAKAMGKDFPPVLWVPMIKDEATMDDVLERDEALKANGISSDIIRVPPLPVHPHFFAEHIDEIDNDQSAKLQALLVEYGVVGEDNSLKKVLTSPDLEPCLRKVGILPAGDEAQSKKDQDTLDKIKSGEIIGMQRTTRRKGGDGPPKDGPKQGPRQVSAPSSAYPIANAVNNQLRVAEGFHKTTARPCNEILDWLEAV